MGADDDQLGADLLRGLVDDIASVARAEQRRPQVGEVRLACGELVERVLVVLDQRVDHRRGERHPELRNADDGRRDDVQQVEPRAERPGELARVVDGGLGVFAEVRRGEDDFRQHGGSFVDEVVHVAGHVNRASCEPTCVTSARVR